MDTEVDVSSTLQGLSQTDQKEISSLLERTQQQAQLNEMVHSLSSQCFKKCVTGKITSDSLSSSEQSCASNCVARWLDVQTSILKNLTGQQQQPAAPKSGGFFG